MQTLGAIAQLGERLTGSQEVRGSIPRSSTNFFKIKYYKIIKVNFLHLTLLNKLKS